MARYRGRHRPHVPRCSTAAILAVAATVLGRECWWGVLATGGQFTRRHQAPLLPFLVTARQGSSAGAEAAVAATGGFGAFGAFMPGDLDPDEEAALSGNPLPGDKMAARGLTDPLARAAAGIPIGGDGSDALAESFLPATETDPTSYHHHHHHQQQQEAVAPPRATASQSSADAAAAVEPPPQASLVTAGKVAANDRTVAERTDEAVQTPPREGQAEALSAAQLVQSGQQWMPKWGMR